MAKDRTQLPAGRRALLDQLATRGLAAYDLATPPGRASANRWIEGLRAGDFAPLVSDEPPSPAVVDQYAYLAARRGRGVSTRGLALAMQAAGFPLSPKALAPDLEALPPALRGLAHQPEAAALLPLALHEECAPGVVVTLAIDGVDLPEEDVREAALTFCQEAAESLPRVPADASTEEEDDAWERIEGMGPQLTAYHDAHPKSLDAQVFSRARDSIQAARARNDAPNMVPEKADERFHTLQTEVAWSATGGHMYDARTLAGAIPAVFNLPEVAALDLDSCAETLRSRRFSAADMAREIREAPLGELLEMARQWRVVFDFLFRRLGGFGGTLDTDPTRSSRDALLCAALVRSWGIPASEVEQALRPFLALLAGIRSVPALPVSE